MGVREQALPAATEPHETRINSVLRPIVFGANDGLVSNLALVIGVAAARSDSALIVLAGIAGLLAGAFSMGVGEYISVQSQQELLEFQRAFQLKQLRDAPTQERSILVDGYMKRGFDPSEAERFADIVLRDPDQAARLLLFEEVGLDDRSIGSPMQAALGSFVAFTFGAFIPLAPYLVLSSSTAFYTSLVISLGALAALGTGIAQLTRRSRWYCAVRQMMLGGAAAAVTYLVGAALRVNPG